MGMIFSVLSLLFILGFIGMIVLIIFASQGKSKSLGGGETVIKTVYNYLVLFATLMMVIGGGIGIFMSAADIFFPETYFQNYNDFRNMELNKPDIEQNKNTPKLSEAEMKIRYNQMVNDEKNRQINRAKNTLIKSFGWVIIPFPIFLYFQRKMYKREKE